VAGAVLCLTVESALREPVPERVRLPLALVAFGSAFLVVLLLCCRYLAEAMAHHPLFFGPLIVVAMAVFSTAFYATFFGRAIGEPGRIVVAGGSDPLASTT
jgi:Na+-translocating ferredoxin:NAD+ oxidoreductase RnfE subunit